MNMKLILHYLSELKNNNNREWYHANKDLLKQANEEFESLVQEMIHSLGKTDSSILHNNAKDLTFKLVRDTRFSKDKSPYNPTFRACIGPMGKLPIPVGYYISIGPDNETFLGGGLFADMFTGATGMVRDYLVVHGDEFDKIVNDAKFKKVFTVKGTALKKVPAGYDVNHPQGEYFKNKSWYLEYPLQDYEVMDSDDFLRIASEIFVLMQPFNQFLNQALNDFTMPERK